MKESVLMPLFSHPLSIYMVDEEIDILKSIDDVSFKSIKQHTSSSIAPTYISKDLKILESYPDAKNIIEKYFNHYKNDVLNYNSTNFKMTTSWITKTIKNSMSHYHSHKNSLYSGVLYLSDSGENVAPIEFTKSNNCDNIFITPDEYNVYNSDEYKLYPQKNMIIFFPSNTMHRIGLHLSNEERYSVSFNFFPVGEIGEDDSSMEVEVK
jgi:uncharacterized protein (TIGR02466 family)